MKNAILFILLVLLLACSQKKKPAEDIPIARDTSKVEQVIPEVMPQEAIVVPDRGVDLSDRYFLIINSYTIQKYAEIWNGRFRERGFHSDVIMRNNNGFYCLALESYNDFNEAKEAVARLKGKSNEYKNLWIMVK